MHIPEHISPRIALEPLSPRTSLSTYGHPWAPMHIPWTHIPWASMHIIEHLWTSLSTYAHPLNTYPLSIYAHHWAPMDIPEHLCTSLEHISPRISLEHLCTTLSTYGHPWAPMHNLEPLSPILEFPITTHIIESFMHIPWTHITTHIPWAPTPRLWATLLAAPRALILRGSSQYVTRALLSRLLSQLSTLCALTYNLLEHNLSPLEHTLFTYLEQSTTLDPQSEHSWLVTLVSSYSPPV
jgi:hypothetical protein